MLKITDLHWLAGLVEGEGCYRQAKDRRNGKTVGSLQLAIGMTDRDVIERAAKLIGSPVYKYEKLPPRKPIYQAVVSGQKAAGWMMTLYSLMGERRRAKIAELIPKWRRQTRKREMCRNGHPLSGENLYSYKGKAYRAGRTQTWDGRGCLICKRKHNREYARWWRQANPERQKETFRIWYEKNKDRVNQRKRTHRAQVAA